MIKIEGLEGITPEELDDLATQAIPKIPLRLFNKSLKILEAKSVGTLMSATRVISNDHSENTFDLLKQSQIAYDHFYKSTNPILWVARMFRLLYAVFVFLVLFSYINLKWYGFFLKRPEYQEKTWPQQFYDLLNRSRGKFFLSKYYFRQADKQKRIQNSLDSLASKIKPAGPKFHFVLTSQQDQFYKLSIKLVEIGAITNVEDFREVFNGYKGKQVHWYFDDLSLIFMIDFFKHKKLISCLYRSKSISICFYDALNNKSFNNYSLNNKANNEGLTGLDDDDSFREFLQKHKGSNCYQVHRIIRDIYGY